MPSHEGTKRQESAEKRGRDVSPDIKAHETDTGRTTQNRVLNEICLLYLPRVAAGICICCRLTLTHKKDISSSILQACTSIDQYSIWDVGQLVYFLRYVAVGQFNQPWKL